MIKLDPRLEAVASFVRKGARVADVGTDHARLAIFLARSGAGLVIASDKNAGPCEAARRAVADAGLADSIPVRKGDGLAPFAPGEVDTVCVAGMGGGLIASILDAAPEVTSSLSSLVLQPMNDAPRLRRWLYENGWHIEDEALALSGGIVYEVIAAAPGRKPLPDEAMLIAGPVLVKRGGPLFSRFIGEKLMRMSRAADGMARSSDPADGVKLSGIMKNISELEAMRGNRTL